jgi:hypothetical protein
MGKAWGIFGPIAVSAVLGPIGRPLISTRRLARDLLVNVPVGAVVSSPARSCSRDDAGRAHRRPRVHRGRIGMALLVYPLVQGRKPGWPHGAS